MTKSVSPQEFEVSFINRAKIPKIKKHPTNKKNQDGNAFFEVRLKNYILDRPGNFLEKFCKRNVLAVYSSRNFLPMRRL